MVSDNDTIIIKSKPTGIFTLLWVLGSLLFWIWIAFDIETWHWYNLLLIPVFILLFLILFLIKLRVRFVRKTQFIINEEGITDQHRIGGWGIIRWDNIYQIETQKMWRLKILRVYVHNPDAIIENLKPCRQALASGIRKKFPVKTPLEIIASDLDYDFNELSILLNERFTRLKRNDL